MTGPIDRRMRNAVLFLAVSSLVTATGCEQDDAATGPAQAAAAAGLRYVGYSGTGNLNPTCALCHEGKSSGWQETGHASALTTLQESSSYVNQCRSCHTTGWDEEDSLYGADDAWAAAGEDTLIYGDVQCETCHGPAGQHNNPYIENPTDVLMPDDSGLWDAGLCGRCHQDTHQPFYEEWQQSAHSGSLFGSVGIVETNENCVRCHVAQSFEKWISSGETDFIPEQPQPLTCQTCHTAHSSDNPGQLRLPLGQNIICARCHSAEDAVPGDFNFITEDHATWEVFTGTLGFTYPDSTYTNSAHTAVLAEQACVACHVYSTPYVSEEIPMITGHTFRPRLEACLQCHTGAANFDINGVQTEIQGLIDQLQAEISSAGPNDRATESYGNALFILKAMESDGSLGIHNTKYTRDLLQDAIDDFTPAGSSAIGRQGGGS